jgi:hypothetical protein
MKELSIRPWRQPILFDGGIPDMPDDESKYTRKQLEAEKALEERLKEQGYIDEEAERKALQTMNDESGGGKKSDTRSGDRE